MHINDTKRCECSCHNQPLIILEGKRAAACIALLIFCFFALFATGYIVGKKVAIDLFNSECNQQSFTDRLHHSMTMLYGPPSLVEQTVSGTQQHLVQADSTDRDQETKSEKNEPRFYAQLAQFSHAQSAQQLYDRLQKRGIKTTIIKRTSTLKKRDGKTVPTVWYVIETPSYPTQHEVAALVSSIKLTEPLTKVKIRKV